MFLAEVKQGHARPSYFSSQTINECPFQGLFSARLFVVEVLFVGDGSI